MLKATTRYQDIVQEATKGANRGVIEVITVKRLSSIFDD